MRHRKHTFKIGRTGAHRKALLANQVCSLITEGQIRTTIVKAKETRRLAEKMVTIGKIGDLHHRRLAISKLRDKDAVAMLFSDVAPKYSSRDGGYTRIIRLGTRLGDCAEMCILQWVEEGEVAKKKKNTAEKTEKPAEIKPEEAVVEEEAQAEESVPEVEAEEEKAENVIEEEKAEVKDDSKEEESEEKK